MAAFQQACSNVVWPLTAQWLDTFNVPALWRPLFDALRETLEQGALALEQEQDAFVMAMNEKYGEPEWDDAPTVPTWDDEPTMAEAVKTEQVEQEVPTGGGEAEQEVPTGGGEEEEALPVVKFEALEVPHGARLVLKRKGKRPRPSAEPPQHEEPPHWVTPKEEVHSDPEVLTGCDSDDPDFQPTSADKASHRPCFPNVAVRTYVRT